MSDSSAKTVVLFVDDEPRILTAFRRVFFQMVDQWDMEFLDGGEEALRRIASGPVDVVISDMRMPMVNGNQVLEAVATHHPRALRVMLTGQGILEKAGAEEEYAQVTLAKPCDPNTIIKLIEDDAANRRNALE